MSVPDSALVPLLEASLEAPLHDVVQHRLRFSLNLRNILEYPSSWLEIYTKGKEDFNP